MTTRHDARLDHLRHEAQRLRHELASEIARLEALRRRYEARHPDGHERGPRHVRSRVHR